MVLLATVTLRADDPVSSSVRYTGEIVRILDRKCAPCHGADGLAMPLTTYREVREWGRAIREEIVEQRMPPWSAARGHARLQNELALTARETATILSWLDGGMPRGDDRDLPRAPEAARDDPPDLHLPLPAQHVPALEEHVVRRVVVDTKLTGLRRVARIAVAPGNRRVLRGALVFIDGEGQDAQWIGAWVPWEPRLQPPASHAFRLAQGARLAVELHYRGGRDAVEDTPAVDLYFVKEESARPTAGAASVGELRVDASSPVRLAAATTVWAIVPSAAAATSSLELAVRRPNGAVEVLLWMPDYRHDWPQTLVLQDGVALPAGTTVTLVAEPRTSAAAVRLSLLPAAGAAGATRSQTRMPAPPRK